MGSFERIEIPTPFSIGRVNCYLFEDEPITLLDPGPATDEAYETLHSHFEDRSLALEDVGRILITHPHMDHFGGVDRIASESGAEVLAHQDAVKRLADPDDHFEREQALFEPFLTKMGVPEKTVGTVVGLPEQYAEFREPVDVDGTLAGGDVVELENGTDYEIVHTPGHAPGSVCFVDTVGGVAFTGDHVMSEISPNPLLTTRPDDPTRRTRSLPAYMESLERLQATGGSVGYGGHRAPVEDLKARIEAIEEHHLERKEYIATLLDRQGPMSPYELMQELFPDLPVTEVFPGMSEIIGHLDLLEDEDRVAIDGGQYRLE